MRLVYLLVKADCIQWQQEMGNLASYSGLHVVSLTVHKKAPEYEANEKGAFYLGGIVGRGSWQLAT